VIVLLDTSHDLTKCAEELGCEVGTLLTPLTRYTLREPERPWAIDNGAFAGFDEKSYWSLLAREAHRKEQCLFVTAADVVGSARRTLELFRHYQPILTAQGWKVALVCQDGQESLPIPWHRLAAVFIGGSTSWKLSEHAAHCIKAARALGKWVHVGRVNDPARFEHFEKLGADSIDGTGISRYTHMREAIAKRDTQEKLWATS
jgi:hypothetical protein